MIKVKEKYAYLYEQYGFYTNAESAKEVQRLFNIDIQEGRVLMVKRNDNYKRDDLTALVFE